MKPVFCLCSFDSRCLLLFSCLVISLIALLLHSTTCVWLCRRRQPPFHANEAACKKTENRRARRLATAEIGQQTRVKWWTLCLYVTTGGQNLAPYVKIMMHLSSQRWFCWTLATVLSSYWLKSKGNASCTEIPVKMWQRNFQTPFWNGI